MLKHAPAMGQVETPSEMSEQTRKRLCFKASQWLVNAAFLTVYIFSFDSCPVEIIDILCRLTAYVNINQCLGRNG